MPRHTERRREIQRLFALRESEGLTLRALADRSGIPVGTLSWWSHQLRREAPSHGFAKVSVTAPEEVTATVSTPHPAEVVLRHPDGIAVELRGDVADRVVDGLLGRLERWS
jgi:transcriptional regulator with XRE-family HTH domain